MDNPREFPTAQRAAAPLELGALHGVGAELDRPLVRPGRLPWIARAAEQLGMRRVQRLVAGERRVVEERGEHIQPRRRPVRPAHRDGAVDLHHRRRREPPQLAVELGDPRPVGLARRSARPCAARRSPPRAGKAPARRRAIARSRAVRPLPDPPRVPQRAVLVVERHVAAVAVDARAAPRVMQQHQREQAEHLRVVGHQGRQQPGQPDRLAAELATHEPVALRRAVALVEDQVQNLQHPGQAVGKRLVGRNAVRDPRLGDLALRAHEALRHGRLARPGRPARSRRRQAAERLQRQRNPRRHRERRVTAGEDQPQPVVLDGARRSSGGCS